MSNSQDISIIIPVYNEKEGILDCLNSLSSQDITVKYEIIIVDDGSRDGTKNILQSLPEVLTAKNMVRTYYQEHSGPGVARNLGAMYAKGSVLVFVDADMVFDKNYLEKLTKPIFDRKVVGTFSQDERLVNPENYWAKCWNIGRFAAAGVYTKNYLHSMIPNPSDKGGIFRAILKEKFNEIGGFATSGDYTDDESLVEKLGFKATEVEGAIFYHKNPSSLIEVWDRARWIGSGRNFTGTIKVKFINLFKFSLPVSFLRGTFISFRFRYPFFLPFKVIYDLAIWLSVINNL